MRQATRTRKELKGDPGHEKAVDDIPLEAHSKGGMSDVRRGEGPSWEFQGLRRRVSGPGKQEMASNGPC